MSSQKPEFDKQVFRDFVEAHDSGEPTDAGYQDGKTMILEEGCDYPTAASRIIADNKTVQKAAKLIADSYKRNRAQAQRDYPEFVQILEQYQDDTRIIYVTDNDCSVASGKGSRLEMRRRIKPEFIAAAALCGAPIVDLRGHPKPDIVQIYLPTIGLDMRDGMLNVGFGLSRARPDVIATMARKLGAKVYNLEPVFLSPGMLRPKTKQEHETIKALANGESIFDAMLIEEKPKEFVAPAIPEGEGRYIDGLKLNQIDKAVGMTEGFVLRAEEDKDVALYGYRVALTALNELRNVMVFEAWSEDAAVKAGAQMPAEKVRDNVREFANNKNLDFLETAGRRGYEHREFARNAFIEVLEAIDPELVPDAGQKQGAKPSAEAPSP